jgi:hypothetical protein
MEAGMILQSLKELAEREGLTEDLDYEPKLVAWVISLDETGRYLGITSTAMPQGPKGKLLPKTMRIPRRAGRTSADLADFLIDKPEYVLGIAGCFFWQVSKLPRRPRATSRYRPSPHSCSLMLTASCARVI